MFEQLISKAAVWKMGGVVERERYISQGPSWSRSLTNVWQCQQSVKSRPSITNNTQPYKTHSTLRSHWRCTRLTFHLSTLSKPRWSSRLSKPLLCSALATHHPLSSSFSLLKTRTATTTYLLLYDIRLARYTVQSRRLGLPACTAILIKGHRVFSSQVNWFCRCMSLCVCTAA